MAAYNEVVFLCRCPQCDTQNAEIISQTHIASSFSGDESGRFALQRYRIGDRMRWFEEQDALFNSWRYNGFSDVKSGETIECCYS